MSAHDAQLTAELLAYIRKFGPCNFALLSSAFLKLPAKRDEKEGLRLRLKRMTETGVITADGTGKARRWAETRLELVMQPQAFVPTLPVAVRPGSDQATSRSQA